MASAELAVVQDDAPAAPPALLEIDSWTAVASKVVRLAETIADTPFVPDGLRGSVPATAAAILAGRELGLGPMTSLANIHVIKGKPALSAALMRALILSQGHQIETVDISDTRAVVRGRRKGEAGWEEASFTRDQAAKARIDLGGYPQDKLYARATSRLARRKFADVIAGMPYSAEELEDGEVSDDAPAPAANGQQPAKPAARTARRKTAAGGRKGEDDQGGEDRGMGADRVKPSGSQRTDPPRPEAPGPAVPQPPLPGEEDQDATPPQPEPGERHGKLVGIVQGQLKRLGFAVDDSDRDERLRMLATLAQVRYDTEAITSTTDFDEDELSVIADTLAKPKNRAALDALLKAAREGGGDA